MESICDSKSLIRLSKSIIGEAAGAGFAPVRLSLVVESAADSASGQLNVAAAANPIVFRMNFDFFMFLSIKHFLFTPLCETNRRRVSMISGLRSTDALFPILRRDYLS
jgi:hypothetical protein